MNPGNIVRYSPYPHYELHVSGLTGIVVSRPYVLEDEQGCFGDLEVVDVMWSESRAQGIGASKIAWEYVDELEVVVSE